MKEEKKSRKPSVDSTGSERVQDILKKLLTKDNTLKIKSMPLYNV
jgi:hypothetical protein